jgi:hypothetical protein
MGRTALGLGRIEAADASKVVEMGRRGTSSGQLWSNLTIISVSIDGDDGGCCGPGSAIVSFCVID